MTRSKNADEMISNAKKLLVDYLNLRVHVILKIRYNRKLKRQRTKEIIMTDTERLNKLESFLNNLPSNGIAIMPLLNHEGRLFSIDDLADEDGSNLGDELCLGKSLREVIDNLETPVQVKQMLDRQTIR